MEFFPRELPDRRAPDVADRLRGYVLVGRGVLGDAVHVQPALVGEGAAADVGPVGVGRQVHQLRDVVRHFGEPLQALFAEHLQAHL